MVPPERFSSSSTYLVGFVRVLRGAESQYKSRVFVDDAEMWRYDQERSVPQQGSSAQKTALQRIEQIVPQLEQTSREQSISNISF